MSICFSMIVLFWAFFDHYVYSNILLGKLYKKVFQLSIRKESNIFHFNLWNSFYLVLLFNFSCEFLLSKDDDVPLAAQPPLMITKTAWNMKRYVKKRLNQHMSDHKHIMMRRFPFQEMK